QAVQLIISRDVLRSKKNRKRILRPGMLTVANRTRRTVPTYNGAQSYHSSARSRAFARGSTKEKRMSTTSAPESKRSNVRFSFAAWVLLIAGLALALIWFWPMGDPDEVMQRFATFVVAFGTLAGLTLWLVFFSGLPWTVRLAVVVLVPAL